MPFLKLPSDSEIEAIFADPQPGDCFHEWYTFWGYVVHRDGDRAVIMTASAPCTFPDDGKVEVLTLEALRQRFAYETIPGYFVTGAGRGHDVAGWWQPEM